MKQALKYGEHQVINQITGKIATLPAGNGSEITYTDTTTVCKIYLFLYSKSNW